MKICTQTDVLTTRYPLETALTMIKEAGFDAADFSMYNKPAKNDPRWWGDNYRKEAEALRRFTEELGLPILQAHAPFSYNVEGVTIDGMIFPETRRAVEIAGILGARCIVVHPVHHFKRLFGFEYEGNEERAFEINMDYYGRLAPTAAQYGVKICVENMWCRDSKRKYISHDTCSRAEEFCRYIDTLEERFPGVFTACLDMGHVPLVRRSLPEYIRQMGGRIGALHVHDNNYVDDLHTLPGHAKVEELPEAFRALHEVGYSGIFTLEADNFIKMQQSALLPAALNYMATVSRYYAQIVEIGND